ncbi:unnamed protein product, partial [Onchocerca ochengi]|uniref:Uncharacterized protein n=1 Tax=Onchocerca ochengi TaxID=42157 RepID=A0A182E9E2_ONCOC
MPGAEPVM